MVCRQGDVELVSWMCHTLEFSKVHAREARALKVALEANRLDLADWLASRFELGLADCIGEDETPFWPCVCKNGSLDKTKRCADTFHLNICDVLDNDVYVFRLA